MYAFSILENTPPGNVTYNYCPFIITTANRLFIFGYLTMIPSTNKSGDCSEIGSVFKQGGKPPTRVKLNVYYRYTMKEGEDMASVLHRATSHEQTRPYPARG